MAELSPDVEGRVYIYTAVNTSEVNGFEIVAMVQDPLYKLICQQPMSYGVSGGDGLYYSHETGRKKYEISNHLDNVYLVVSDKKVGQDSLVTQSGDGFIDHFTAHVVDAADYYPYGWYIQDRKIPLNAVDDGGYRFGFNGQEKDDEISGAGNSYTAEFWQYDPKLGRRWNIDPQWQRLPGQSPYSANNNNPIQYTDPDGGFGIIGATIGAVVGAAAEFGGQVISNVVQGKPLLERIDWADVVISAGEGAIAGATGGVSLLVSGGFEAVKASIDYTDEEGFSDVLRVTSDNKKDLVQGGIDFAGGLLGLVTGKFLPSGDFVKDAVADQFVKNGIKSEGHFLTGYALSELGGGLADAVQSGFVQGLYGYVVDALQSSGNDSENESGGLLIIMLPEVEVSAERNEVTPKGEIKPKGEKKVHDHIKTIVNKRNN